MNKFAIYTAVVGNYDEIRQPLVIDSRFDYYLFSNTISEKQIGVWQIKPIEYTNSDQVKIARYVKTHPETLLPEYTATLWMDANIQIASAWVYNRFLELYQGEVQVAVCKHPHRDCIYEELCVVCASSIESLNVGRNWILYLEEQKYPKHNGLYETGVIYRRNRDSVKEMDLIWWFYIDSFSRRDQLFFNYVLWKLGLRIVFFIEEETIRTSQHFLCVSHPRHRLKTKNLGPTYLSCFLRYLQSENLREREQYCKKWLNVLKYPTIFSVCIFFIWSTSFRLKRFVKNYFSQ